VLRYKPVDYQAIRYYSAPKMKAQLGSLDEVDPEVLKTFEKLGISLNEQAHALTKPSARANHVLWCHPCSVSHLGSWCTRLTECARCTSTMLISLCPPVVPELFA